MKRRSSTSPLPMAWRATDVMTDLEGSSVIKMRWRGVPLDWLSRDERNTSKQGFEKKMYKFVGLKRRVCSHQKRRLRRFFLWDVLELLYFMAANHIFRSYSYRSRSHQCHGTLIGFERVNANGSWAIDPLRKAIKAIKSNEEFYVLKILSLKGWRVSLGTWKSIMKALEDSFEAIFLKNLHFCKFF